MALLCKSVCVCVCVCVRNVGIGVRKNSSNSSINLLTVLDTIWPKYRDMEGFFFVQLSLSVLVRVSLCACVFPSNFIRFSVYDN